MTKETIRVSIVDGSEMIRVSIVDGRTHLPGEGGARRPVSVHLDRESSLAAVLEEFLAH